MSESSDNLPTDKKKLYRKLRKARQHKRRLFQMIKEDLELSGDLPTKPMGGLKPDVVDPATQSEQDQSRLIGQAIRNGWAVPEERKPDLVDEMIKIVDSEESSTKEKVNAFRALVQADKDQYERDQPEKAGKAKGGVNINNTNGVVVGEVFDDIKKIEENMKLILNKDSSNNEQVTDRHQEVSDLRENGHAQPLDEKKSD